jgi:hypothetical protein
MVRWASSQIGLDFCPSGDFGITFFVFKRPRLFGPINHPKIVNAGVFRGGHSLVAGEVRQSEDNQHSNDQDDNRWQSLLHIQMNTARPRLLHRITAKHDWDANMSAFGPSALTCRLRHPDIEAYH